MKFKSANGFRTFLIANPTAGHGQLKRQWKSRIQPFLKKELAHFDFEFTKNKAHATELTQQALQNGYNLIVAMGGDGTINEVINGFFEKGKNTHPEACLGILPFGSGGDFIRSLKFERDYQKAAHHLQGKKTKAIDVGWIKFKDRKQADRYFVNIANVGLVAEIMSKVNSKYKRLPALARYLSGSFQGFFSHHNQDVRLHLAGKGAMETKLTNLIIANGSYFGRGMHPAPNARLDDGLFEIILLKDMSFLKLCLHFPEIYARKKVASASFLDHHESASIQIESLGEKDALRYEMDGEVYGHGDAQITLLKQKLKIKI
ncbi:MAG: diacylglycerol kinase family lipid kinase [Deltaproteobacteria bacterium]|nr:diacylglycerol kinase family lipid kinase [Deltaproteobacteria bacterium]